MGSCWTSGVGALSYPQLTSSLKAQTVVIGGGIVGLTAALRLREAGREVVVLEALDVGGQVTGRSSAKITTQHRLIYRHLIDTIGPDQARLYADANRAGCELIRNWVEQYQIRCALESRAAYVYALAPDELPMLTAEASAAQSLGLPADMVDHAPLPFETAGALRFLDQAQFNPAQYLAGLAEAIVESGGRIFQQSRVRSIEKAERWRVVTDQASVEADNVVVATNMTIQSPLGMARRTMPRMHVAMAFRLRDPDLLDGMFISSREPTRSFRTGADERGQLLLALGPGFVTGQERDVASRFVELEAWVRSHFELGEVAWRWCNEDYDTPDRIAYVGPPDEGQAAGFYIATGFNAWGISNGAAAGMLLCDLIDHGHSRWKDLYDPSRPAPDNFNNGGDTQSNVAGFEQIQPGQGGVVTRGDDKIAIYRDEDGSFHTLSAQCTHKGCTVTWNNADRTWDCPCHGSLFRADGSVLHGPARTPLARARL